MKISTVLFTLLIATSDARRPGSYKNPKVS